MTPRRVAITGLGIISCLGLSCQEVAHALRIGASGISTLPDRKALGFQSSLSGTIKGYNPTSVLDKKRRKTLPDFGLWAWSAVEQALSQAKVGIDTFRGDERTGLIFGNDSSAVASIEQVNILRECRQTSSIGSGHIFRLLTSTITLNLGVLLGLRGISYTVGAACASGAMAIGQAAQLISGGHQDRIICGGAQEISWQSMCSFDALGAFSRQEENPAQASRPFDRNRDGLVPSGGAAALFLESYEHAKDRGATILAEVLGYGNTSDGYNIIVPSGEGIERAMSQALMNAKLSPRDIQLLLAHATSTPAGDAAEAKAIQKIFSIEKSGVSPLITALKAYTGHEFWMAGASQVIYGILMVRENFVAGNINLEYPAEEAACLNLPQKTMTAKVNNVLCNASGFGGTNVSLVIDVKSV